MMGLFSRTPTLLAIRCAPPDNKPLPTELVNCSQYLITDCEILDNVKVIVMLGRIGFDVTVEEQDWEGSNLATELAMR